ncbi:mas-related G-protein coupled receptor member D-like [Biomphalaria glabrata]|uniref:Mas-related G-protein coupled receptor member D-like n=1 Tax=Biomphalaria glabrata TaxID=6526 RepID=A0A9U8ELN9_BIOGL|nr:mas-related G-protein coupled receptor member D-like [Biomphalaria glabrata]KAI8731540.1 thyrotropin-releasing hormone receptor-like [Biomphalaria glabrata]
MTMLNYSHLSGLRRILSDTSVFANVSVLIYDQTDNEGEYISDFARTIFIFVNHVIVDMSICVFGIVGNCLSITVFLKQGLSKSVNLSLFAMSVSDLIGLTFQVWHNFCMNPYLEQSDLPIDFLDVQILTAGTPNVAMTRITCWLTMYITAERCVSVLFPLKVGRIVTFPRRVVIIVFCFSVNLAFFLPLYASYYLTFKFYPESNKTKLGISVQENHDMLIYVMNASHAYLSIISFVGVIMNTAILVVTLKRKAKWRKSATLGQNKIETLAIRDKKTELLVVTVATVLVVCYAPGVTCALIEIVFPEFNFDNKLENLYHVMWSFCFLFSSINASINVIVFYNMSSKYRNTLQEIFSSLNSTHSKKKQRKI